VVHERELLAEELGVGGGLPPERCHRAQIRGRRDQRDPDREAVPLRLVKDLAELALLADRRTRVSGQEHRLGDQNVAGRVSVRARERWNPCRRQCDHHRGDEQLYPQPRPRLGPRISRADWRA